MQEGNTIYVGLDVHKKSIYVSVVATDSAKVVEAWQIANEKRAVGRMVKKLRKLGNGPIMSCYEAGPCGYVLQRQLREAGVECQVIAPSLIPTRPGDRIKTDKRDAEKLAKHLRAGLLTEVHPPTPEDEAVRDLVRAREDAKDDQRRARQRLGKFLLRRGLVYRDGSHWTKRHKVWLQKQKLENPVARSVFEAYLFAVEQADERLELLRKQIQEVAESPRYRQSVSWLCCLRGVKTTTAMTIIAELHDFRRFTSAPQLMSYIGVTPSEYSSGGHSKRGGITKAGNGRVRRVLVEAAWSYRHRPAVSADLKKRRKGQPLAVISIADRAQTRLHRKYWRMKELHNKPHNVVTVALARELVGFIWAILTLEHQLEQPA